MGNSHLLLTRLPLPTKKRTKNTMKIFGVDNNKNEAKTHLQWVPTSLLKKKKEISPKLNASTVRKKAIILAAILRRGNKSQKTSSSLGDLPADNYS